MEMNNSILLQKQVKDNSEDLQNEFFDMKNWEKSMKEKEQYLLSELNQQRELPSIRNRNKKKLARKENKSTEHSKKIKSYDYTAWEKFDAEKACENLEKGEKSDDSTDESLSEDQLEQNHNKAIVYKQEGNHFVQLKKWGDAIAAYSTAIQIFPYDAIFFANRALCFLKQDNLYSAEADCTFSIEIDDTYMKAYHRRAIARMELKHYEEAKQDIEKMLTLESSNKEAKALLIKVNKQLKHLKPVITSEKSIADDISVEKKIVKEKSDNVKSNKKIIDTKKDNNNEDSTNIKSTVKSINTNVTKQMRNSHIPDWLPEKNNVTIVKPIRKLPHLCSKESFRRVPVQEADLTKLLKEEIKTCVKIKNVKLDISSSNTIKSNEYVAKSKPVETKFTEICTEVPPVPKSAVQFLINWKKYNSSDFRYKYLKQLSPNSLPKIFKDSMESNIFSDILTTLRTVFVKRQEPIFSYLKDLSNVRRFRALVLFINNSEKQDLEFMFSYCKTSEKISEEELAEIQNKYEV